MKPVLLLLNLKATTNHTFSPALNKANLQNKFVKLLKIKFQRALVKSKGLQVKNKANIILSYFI